ncbi:MAG: lysoplasmalogenase family protein [Clostridia bacterium]|nr:lysoplasmalogenase family protein [Clostridia bacterium]
MQVYQIVFAVVYICLLITYFFVEVRPNQRLRASIKIPLASLFLLLAIINTVLNPVQLYIKLALLLACILALVGDILLVIADDMSWFVRGGICFSVCNCISALAMFAYLIVSRLPFIDWWWFILTFIILTGIVISLQATRVINLGKMRAGLTAYLTTITLCCALGLAIAVCYATPFTILLGLGYMLFMISDYFLITYKVLIHKKPLLVLNSATYFVGMFLIAMAMAF